MPEIDLTKPAIGFAPCIVVQWHDQVRRYVRALESLTIDGDAYTAVPSLDFEFPTIDGGVVDRPVTLVVPDDLDPFDKMAFSTYAEVEVSILEADFSDLDASPRVAFVGHVGSTNLHYRGKSRLMSMQLLGRKHFLKDVSLGIKATDRCPLFYGDHVCGATVTTVSATISTINGTVVNFSSLPSDSVKGSWANGRYTRGFVEKDGLRILIRRHSVGNKRFTLAKAPPQMSGYTWEGATVTVYEGCDKGIDACEAHGRQSRFLGVGRRMPKHNPIIENAS